jgi:hypothetical protein
MRRTAYIVRALKPAPNMRYTLSMAEAPTQRWSICANFHLCTRNLRSSICPGTSVTRSQHSWTGPLPWSSRHFDGRRPAGYAGPHLLTSSLSGTRGMSSYMRCTDRGVARVVSNYGRLKRSSQYARSRLCLRRLRAALRVHELLRLYLDDNRDSVPVRYPAHQHRHPRRIRRSTLRSGQSPSAVHHREHRIDRPARKPRQASAIDCPRRRPKLHGAEREELELLPEARFMSPSR